jgi:hypothetical protein
MTRARKTPKYTPLEKKFVEAYLQNGMRNQTQAAIDAGYSAKSAHVTASRLLKEAKIAALIQQRLKEQTMTTDEALWRLTEFGRGSLGDFIGLSQEEIAKHPKAFLLKHYSIKRETKHVGAIEFVTDHIRFELHDPQTADREIIRYHETASKMGQAGKIINELPMLEELINRMLAAGMNPEEVFNRMLGKLRVEQPALDDKT